jgi:elongation factor Tu
VDSTADITARIYLLTPEDGGRHVGIEAGYRPSFYIGCKQTDGAIYPVGRERVEPGEECEVRIKLLHPQYLGDSLKPCALIRLQEGRKVVGFGTVSPT